MISIIDIIEVKFAVILLDHDAFVLHDLKQLIFVFKKLIASL